MNLAPPKLMGGWSNDVAILISSMVAPSACRVLHIVNERMYRIVYLGRAPYCAINTCIPFRAVSVLC